MTEPLKRVKQAGRRLRSAEGRTDQARAELHQAVIGARESHTLEQIGSVLGITKQGVYDLLKRGEER